MPGRGRRQVPSTPVQLRQGVASRLARDGEFQSLCWDGKWTGVFLKDINYLLYNILPSVPSKGNTCVYGIGLMKKKKKILGGCFFFFFFFSGSLFIYKG